MAKGPIPGWGDANPPVAGEHEEPPPHETVRAPSASENGPAETTPAAADELNDRMLGDFRILRRLGRGGMAEVYLAEQVQLKRNVAVKVLRKERVTDETYLKRFKTEAMAAGSLSHPNIIQVLMIGEQEGTQYIAQEYVPGMNLREYLARKGPPELSLALHIMKQVAAALQAAHSAGIVHRDIKPENIMITRKGDVKVADFGLAQLTQGGERLNLTQDGVTMGTPLYMSPEQVNGSKLDLRTDIYSLGVTCYHMLTGAPPFRGETAISVAVQHLKQAAEPLEKIRGDLPPLLCRIIHKMMAKETDKRYQSAQAVIKDLKRVTGDGDAAQEHPTAEPEPAATKAAVGAERHWALRLLMGLWCIGDWPLSRQIWTVLALVLLVASASAGIGWATRVPNPLSAPLPMGGVPRKTSAASQYFYALTLKNDIPAWQAVVDYFPGPEDRLFRYYAEQQLATLLLAKSRYDEAQEIFDRFAQFGESERQWRAFGLAGQAILLNLRGEYKRSQQVLDSLQSPVRSAGPDASDQRDSAHRQVVLFDLLDDKMRAAVAKTIHRNLEKINQEMSQEWDEIFKRHEQQDAAPAAGTDSGK
ncbi:MAG TPA: protein kinase [Planctomycetaceae bacterium]|nr:protein kinase [Planctomycetaceae bacterium]